MESNGVTNGLPLQEKHKQAVSPREFILRHIKYLPWILLSVAAALIIAKIKLRYATPIYRTEARLLIKKESPYGRTNDKFDEIFMGGGSIQNVYNEIEILKSRPLAARVAKELRLQTVCYNKGNIRSTLMYPNPPLSILPLTPADSTGDISMELTVVDNDHFRINEQPKAYSFGETIAFGANQFKVMRLDPQVFNVSASNIYLLSYSSLASAADRIVGGLNVNLADNAGQIVNLSYESENTNLAKDILNTLMSVYRESNIEDKRQMRISTLLFIDERLDSLRNELGIVERGMTEYVEANKAFNLEKQSELYLDKLNTEVTNLAQQDLRLSVNDFLIRHLNQNPNTAVPVDLGTQEPTLLPLIAEYNQLQIERQNALATMPATNPYIQQNIDPRLGKLRSDILQGLQTVRQSYSIARSSIERQSNIAEGRLQSIPSKGRELADRARQQKIKEELYLFLLQKKEETAIASASTVSDTKIVEPGRASGGAIKPNRRSIYMMAIFLGLLIPGIFIGLKEYLNDKIREKADIEKLTDAPFIGEIGHSEDSGALVVTHNSRRFISEQFRIIRTNLQFILNKVQNPVILVTSSFSGEGKSFVSTNMGAVMALTGKRTVIIELDIRKPKVVANLDLKKKQAGITNFIVGRVNMQDIIIPVPEIQNLFVIPCGPVPPNPAEMLLDPKLKELFEYARRNFDVVIVDTAPVGLVSDAIILGEQADCTLYILRQNYTFKKQVGLIDELYRNKKLPRLSLLLNDVEVGRGYSGYYGNYGYGYGYGYGAGYFDEEGKKKKKSLLSRLIKK
jgi:tyrosine-protein kinase Etk/Wzc